MANIAKMKRDRMLAFLEQLKAEHSDDESIRAFNEIENHIREKKYGLIWEDHTEAVDEMLDENIPVFCEDPDRRLCKDPSLPFNFIIEGDNLQALYLLEKTHRGKVDCIYIDPPYNTGARDWKYNNDYVDGNDLYRHSKWLSMMKNRLQLAKHLLNPADSILIVTIDEKEYLRLGCLLEELFPTAKIQMVSSVINSKGVARDEFFRVNEYLFFVRLGVCTASVLPLPDEWLGNKRLLLYLSTQEKSGCPSYCTSERSIEWQRSLLCEPESRS
ncbi:MAG: DNA methyltransferase [Hominicoprocola sp.]